MIDFILSATDDSNQPTAVVNLLADWSKAFNKCNHNIIMRILASLRVPMWLLRLILSYLENRKMILRFRGCTSDPEDMPGGMPQGTLLGVILYILYINPVGFPAELTIKISDTLHDYWEALNEIPDLTPSVDTLPSTMQSIKFMDDATLQESVDLQNELATNRDRSGPLPFWESSGKVLPKENTELQNQIDLIKALSDHREMSLNTDKTCVFIVNFTNNHQFRPLLKIPGCDTNIDRVLETKLLGYWFTTNMKPHRHVEYILAICYKRLWAVTKLKKAGVSNDDILHFYYMKIRSVLETNSAVFHSMLTQEDTDDIERVQKIVLRVLLDENYVDYHNACILLNVQSLQVRRIKMALNFALRCLTNEKFKHFFKPNAHITIRNPDKFDVPFAHTSRYQNSPRVYLTHLLNDHFRNGNTE